MGLQSCVEAVRQAIGPAGVRVFFSNFVEKEGSGSLDTLFVVLLACR